MAKALTCACGASLVRTGTRGPLPSVCADCKRRNAERTKQRWRQQNRERHLATQRIRSKRWSDANRERERARGRDYYRQRAQDPSFLEQEREREKERRLSDPERISAIRRKSYRKHAAARRAARREGYRIRRDAIYNRDGGRCHLCGKKVLRESFHIDHLIPRSKGGTSEPENLAVAHAFCNQSRNAGRLPAQLRLVA